MITNHLQRIYQKFHKQVAKTQQKEPNDFQNSVYKIIQNFGKGLGTVLVPQGAPDKLTDKWLTPCGCLANVPTVWALIFRAAPCGEETNGTGGQAVVESRAVVGCEYQELRICKASAGVQEWRNGPT